MEAPTFIVTVDLLSAIPVTERTTVTLQVAVISLLLFDMAVTVTVPGLWP